jgi:hypothetical protein
MRKIVHQAGERFARLVLTEELDNRRWLCKCDCGKSCVVRAATLRSGSTRSCGCLQRERASEANLKHGHAVGGRLTKTYVAWANMLQRCCNVSHERYKDYGGRGVEVCERWRTFNNFLADMGPCPRKGLTIERTNNNGNYEPGNCVWDTYKAQGNNTRHNRLIEYQQITMTLAQWAERVELRPDTIRMRLDQLGWSVERALATPVRGRSPLPG